MLCPEWKKHPGIKFMNQPIENKQENLFWADMVRACAVFGVILIHVAADVVTLWGKVPASWWWAANFYDSLVRGAVPVYIMLSGALLLPKAESFGDFFRKRFARIMIPFVVWTLVYLFWKKCFYRPDLGLAEAIRWVLSGSVHFHLWFLYLIVGLYLVTPLFRILVAHASRREMLYFLGLCFVISSLVPFAEKLCGMFLHVDLKFGLPVEPAQGFIGYFVLGYFIRCDVTEKSIPMAWTFWVVSLLVCMFGTYFLSRHFHGFTALLYENMSPNVVFFTAAFFMIMKNAGPFFERHMSPGFRASIVGLSSASFGIYLIHPMILDAMIKARWGFVLKGDMPHPVYAIPLAVVVTYALSFLAVSVIQKIPWLRKIV